MTAPITDTRTEQVSRMVVQYEKDMLMLCFVYLRNMDLAQEALQESFLKAYTRFDTFRGASSEKTWLTRIVINTCTARISAGRHGSGTGAWRSPRNCLAPSCPRMKPTLT